MKKSTLEYSIEYIDTDAASNGEEAIRWFKLNGSKGGFDYEDETYGLTESGKMLDDVGIPLPEDAKYLYAQDLMEEEIKNMLRKGIAVP